MSDQEPAARPPALRAGGWESFDAIMPVVLWLVFNRLFGLPWAIAAATLWSVKVSISRRRRGLPVGKFIPAITVLIVARGIVGIATDSEDVYFGLGIAGKAVVGVGLIGMVLIGKNLFTDFIARFFALPEFVRLHPAYRNAVDRIVLVGGVAELASVVFDIWLLGRSSADQYVIVRFFVNWPLSVLVIGGGIAYLAYSMQRIPGFQGLVPHLEAYLEPERVSRDEPDANEP